MKNCCLALLALSLLVPARAEVGEPADRFEQVTVRREYADSSRRKARRHKGVLRFGADALSFESRKYRVELPYDEIRIVHRGTLGTDVDSEWIVITAMHDDRLQRLGLRDGKKLGYGARLEQFAAALDARLVAGGYAQYAAPEGFNPIATPDRKLAFAAPQGAELRVVEGEVGESGALRTGRLALESPGVEGAWTLVMRESPRGTGCDRFDGERVGALLRESDGLETIELTETTVAHCEGATLRARRGGNAVLGRVWVNDDLVYAMLVETPPERVAAVGDLLDRVIATVRLPLLP